MNRHHVPPDTLYRHYPICAGLPPPNVSVIAYPSSYYAATVADPPEREVLKGEVAADVCVIGAGFTGLSCALHLAERGYDVVVLEAARAAWGASGRNGGQMGTGLRLDTLALERLMGRPAARVLWDMTEEAKAMIREYIHSRGIDCDFRPGNLLAITRARFIPEIERETEHLARHYDYRGYRMLGREDMAKAVASPRYCAGRMDDQGGHLNAFKLGLGLAGAVEAAGAKIFESSRVNRIQWGATARVATEFGHVAAKHVVLCGNAYLGDAEPHLQATIMPITNHQVVTSPLGESRARALIPEGCCVHSTKFVVDYYRLTPDFRLQFGGGETYSRNELPNVKAFVRRYMLRVFPQLADVPLDYGWSGQLAITSSRLPHFGRVGPNGFFAQGFSGHGVALTQLAGRLLAEAVAGSVERFDLFAGLTHRRFPGGTAFRKPLLVLGMLYYSLRDQW